MEHQSKLLECAKRHVDQLDSLKSLTLMKGYHQIFEQYPGLHPDGFDDNESGWPNSLKMICAEMWRRVEDSESGIKVDHMYYVNKNFRKLVAKSARTNRRAIQA